MAFILHLRLALFAVISNTPQGRAYQEQGKQCLRTVLCRTDRHRCIPETEHMPLQPKRFPAAPKDRFGSGTLCVDSLSAVHMRFVSDNHKFCNYSMVSLLCRLILPAFFCVWSFYSLHFHTIHSVILCYAYVALIMKLRKYQLKNIKFLLTNDKSNDIMRSNGK